ncbi:LTA synthase family protein [Nocardioides rubriscoriae]|uniref:LTA synthase family protein n=1 Tax=Nocardioides rubriscoriae TaxID=642762 RepID=UPI0011DF47ED|nr:LTA synthase family protein [Nocardioides rubriscoriae]
MSEQLIDTPVEPAGELRREPAERTAWQAVLWAQRVSWLGAMACALVLELSGLIGQDAGWWRATFVNGLGYVADSLVIWLVLLVLIALTNRVILSLGIVVAFTVVIAVANRVKLGLRSEPIYPSDVDFLKQPKFLATMVAPHMMVVAGIGLAAIVLAAWFLGRRYEPRMVPIWPSHLSLGRQFGAVLVRASVVTLALALLVDTTHFNSPGNPWRGIYEVGDGQKWRYWDQRANYNSNGFVGGFLYNMPTVAMETPEGYSEQTMDALATRYERLAARVNRTRTGSLDDVNVVLVLSESFSDPTRLNGFQLDEDPIPKTRALMEAGTSGTMMPQLLGGGTANMEFEMLTGQSIGLFAPQLSSPYQMLVPGFDQYPSAVGWFGSHGHTPIAVHPYITSFYKRDQVYKVFGFDSFIHDTTMAEQERIDDNEFIDDQSAFDEVRRQIDASASPLMVNLVTMQNHIPVDGNYHDPIGVQGVDGAEADRIGNYARGLAHTDDALADFLQKLKDSDEKTVVVFYGDHLPGIYSSDTIDQNPGLGMYTTPFFLWSSEGTPQKVLPQSSPTQFLPMLYDLANAPIPPYFALLDRLRTKIAALEQGRMLDPTGQQITVDDLDRQGTRILNDARLVQYDFSIGNRYSVDRMWPGSLR